MSMITTLELATAGLGLLVFAWLVLRARKALEMRRLQRRFRRGMAGQQQARRYLERRGFEIVAEQQALPATMKVDGAQRDFEVRIDYITKKGRKTFAVEVKTGKQATDPLDTSTRRQLREYSCLIPFDGLYLLDMDAPKLMRVRFPPSLTEQHGTRWVWILAIGFFLGVAATLLLGHLGRGS